MNEVSDDVTGRALPSGTVTFVFSDIEGSTQRWDRDRAAMQSAVRRHDAIVRAAIVAHDGHVFKTIGDAFCASFHRPEDAVAAAASAQRTLAEEDFSAVDGIAVRMAIHTGTADERDGDYFGPAVNRVARILAIGNGGQVLVSGVTADLVVADLPSYATMRDLGEHRLKDLERPEQVYQLVLRGLRTDFPALRSLDRLPNNLPAQLSSFVGRDDVVAELAELVRANRLVTLVGSGGVGKTRVSLQVAADLLDGSSGGVWFVELAPLTDGELIASTIAAAMGITLAGEDRVRALTDALGAVRRLIVLDNCEHLVDAAARVAEAIVLRCPNAHVLASSRQPLGIAGEIPYRMPSLAVPREGETIALDESRRFGAVALFEARALVANRAFALDAANVATVVEICRRLDGIPMAIELVAARVAHLSPLQVRQRLDERFRLLTGGSRTAMPRQQTLRALIDWSYDLLSESERLLFDRLGIFVGAATVEAITAICGGDGLDEIDTFDHLAALVDKSLVIVEAGDHVNRYRFLESTRAYALERLQKRGERATLAKRHLTYYLTLARAADEAYERSDRESEYAPMKSELDNVRAALDRAREPGGDPIGGAELACCPVFSHTEQFQWLRAFSHVDFASARPVAAKFWSSFAPMLSNFGDVAAGRDAASRALAIARADGNVRALSFALYHSLQALEEGSEEREAALFAELDTLVASAPPTAAQRRRLQWVRAYRDLRARRYAEALVGFERFDAEQIVKGNRRAGPPLVNLAECYHGLGDTVRAIEIARENRDLFERDRQIGDVMYNETLICALLASIDRFDEAFETGRSVASMRTSVEFDFLLDLVAIPIALVYVHRRDVDRAAILAGWVSSKGTKLDGWYSVASLVERLQIELQSLADDARTALMARGAEMTRDEAIALAFPDLVSP